MTALFIASITFFFCGIVDAITGGGGLISVPMFMAIGLPVHCIGGTNLCSTSIGSCASFWEYARNGKVHWRSGLMALPFAILGSRLGAELNMVLDEHYLELFMLILLPLIAIVMLVKKDFGSECHVEELTLLQLLLSSAFIGLVIGTYQGFYSAGAGMFYIMAFALLTKLDLQTSSGNAKLITLIGNITASLTYALSGLVLWKFVAVDTVFYALGSYLGAELALKKGAKVIRPVFYGILLLLFIHLVREF